MKYFKILLLITSLFMLIGCGALQKKDIDMDSISRAELQAMAEKTGATKVRAFTALTGEGIGALDTIDGADLNDGDVGIVVTATGGYLYSLDATNGGTESSPNIITPSGTPGDKRWVLVSLYANDINASPQDDGSISFVPLTATETQYRIGPNHDSAGDDNDGFEIRRSDTPGTSVDFRTNRNSVAYGADKVTQSYTETQFIAFDWTTDVTTGDGKFYFHVGQKLDSLNLSYCHAKVITAGITGTTDIYIYNVTDSVDVLSVPITIDSNETGSDTAGSYTINTANDDITENDLLRIDIDSVSTTPPKGLLITMGFSIP